MCIRDSPGAGETLFRAHGRIYPDRRAGAHAGRAVLHRTVSYTHLPDGLAVCKKLREDESTRPIPVLMLTARSEEVDRVLGLEIGADDYITCLLYTSHLYRTASFRTDLQERLY